MGAQPSSPKPGTDIQVIGAGLPRTGTASFSRALSILLDAPVYHGGTQITLGPSSHIKSWISVLTQWPPQSPSATQAIQTQVKMRLEGYAAVTDSPCNGLIPELLTLYPDAVVICTVRDPDAWVKSMATVANAATLWFLRFVLFLLPGMRHFPTYINLLRKQWIVLYGKPEPVTTEHWETHMAYLKRTVPEERLVFFDVKSGWEPLCKVLGKEVPEVEFPKINDGKAIEELTERFIAKGLMYWGAVLVIAGLCVARF
ncbi:P-loop containing nucleoside triphosphate hydrolase protein [Boeremia exigua]|uniref:P-loop containing nucleoside triphosphate hydrolase protein n=1 Tax=Boeremia exigua TaxID=749465 RepID=UPI001E8DF53E|nr:P-loop containing nucleoside triphosphate hydrolase protein [Boeremia exigua]KAH6629602.1 P-loop containing nucleoside triphosphate hydrolase protein [Boeremia exigua]